MNAQRATRSEASVNEVRLGGRVSGEPTEVDLPSGTTISRFRIVVPRDSTAMTRGSKAVSDWFSCTAWSGAARRAVKSFKVGDHVIISGSMRRHHVANGSGKAGSVVEIEVLKAKRVA